MGSIIGHSIDYNGAGAMRGQRHIPRLQAACRFSRQSVESVCALRGAIGEASRNEGASPRENERLHWFLIKYESPGTLAPEHFHWLTSIVVTFRFQRAVIELLNTRTPNMLTQTNKPTLYFFKNACAIDPLGGIILKKEQEDALFSPSLEHHCDIKLPE